MFAESCKQSIAVLRMLNIAVIKRLSSQCRHLTTHSIQYRVAGTNIPLLDACGVHICINAAIDNSQNLVACTVTATQALQLHHAIHYCSTGRFYYSQQVRYQGGLVAELLACWTQAQKSLGSNCSCNAVG